MEDVVVAQRRDKLSEIIGRAHGKLQRVLTDAGIDPAIARMIAATRVYQLLPSTVRQQMTTAESEIVTRMVTLFKDVAKADEEGLKNIPFE